MSVHICKYARITIIEQFFFTLTPYPNTSHMMFNLHNYQKIIIIIQTLEVAMSHYVPLKLLLKLHCVIFTPSSGDKVYDHSVNISFCSSQFRFRFNSYSGCSPRLTWLPVRPRLRVFLQVMRLF